MSSLFSFFFSLSPLRSSISFHSLINHPVCVLIHLHPVSPLLITPSPSSPPPPPTPNSISDRCPILLEGLSLRSPHRRVVEVAPLDLPTCADGSPQQVLGVFLKRNPFAVVSQPVDSYVCDSFCISFLFFLGMFRDCAFRTFPQYCH